MAGCPEGQLFVRLNGGEDAEALEAVAAAKVGEAVAGGCGDAHLRLIELHDRSYLPSHLQNARLHARSLAFDGESHMLDALRAQGLEGSLKIDLTISDPLFVTELDRNASKNGHMRERRDRIADRMKDHIAI